LANSNLRTGFPQWESLARNHVSKNRGQLLLGLVKPVEPINKWMWFGLDDGRQVKGPPGLRTRMQLSLFAAAARA